MKTELIEKLQQINNELQAYPIDFCISTSLSREETNVLLQALTSVKSESTEEVEKVIQHEAHEYFKRGQLGFEKAADTERAFYKGAKWMPLTRGGYEYKIYEEVGELLFGSLKMINGTYMPTTWKLNGRWGNQEYDLIPYNPRIHELEEKITSKRSELAELEGELNTLKGK